MYKTIDLFAGIGGIRHGFEKTKNFENVLSCEIDKYACKTYEHLFGENPYNDVTTKEFKEKVKNIQYDVLLAGFPCQAFSIAGLKNGFCDKIRGTLIFDVLEILKSTNPKAFLLENVEGLLTHDKGKTFHIIVKSLIDLGYSIVGVNKLKNSEFYTAKSEDIVRTPYNFGIPQKRARIFIMGFKTKDLKDGYTFPKLPNKHKLNLYNNLNDFLEKKVDPKFYLTDIYVNTLNKHRDKHQSKGSGFGYIVVNDEKNPIANTIMATGGSGKERNIIRQYVKEYDGLENVGQKKSKLNSYKYNNKNLLDLFKQSKIYNNSKVSIKKLEDFLIAVSFGMFPSIKWEGYNLVDGGILLVSKDKNVYLLDLIYHQKEVKKFLLNYSRLDTPSSTRYNMLDLKINKNGEVYFTLNLQIRYKK